MASEGAYRPVYKSAPIIWGLLLLALGVGNWVVGAVRAQGYEVYLIRNPGPETSSDLKNSLLEPPDEAREERSISHAKLEFYELVRGGGRLMVALGALTLLAGIFGLEGPRFASLATYRRKRDPRAG